MSQSMKGISECDPIYSYIYPLMNILPGLQVKKMQNNLVLMLFFHSLCEHFKLLRGSTYLSLLETDIEYFKRKKISGKKDKEI